MLRSLQSVVSLACLSSLALAQSTYVVDDSGGPGVNFTDLPTAIAAASPGDRLLVQEGSYSSFVLDKGLAVLAQGSVQTGDVTVTGIPAGDVAVLAGMNTRVIDISQCAGAVLLDQIAATNTPSNAFQTSRFYVARVRTSADVRFQRCQLVAPDMGTTNDTGPTGLLADGSRVEVTMSTVQGGAGGNVPSSGCWDGNPGGKGIWVYNSARVHIALSTVKGGNGSNGTNNCGVGGDGGDALRVEGSSSAIVAGIPTNLLRGGAAGTPNHSGTGILAGAGGWVAGGSELLHSGVTFVSGGAGVSPNSPSATLVTPADPTLRLDGTTSAGESVLLSMFGVGGFNARLQQGSRPLVDDDGWVEIERLNNRIRLHPLGPIPSGGELSLGLTVPSSAPAGWTRVFQGYEIDSATNTLVQRTNSVFVVVR